MTYFPMGKRSPIIHAVLVSGVMGLEVAAPLFQVKGVNVNICGQWIR
jgi:hypothetical protein